MYCSSVLFKVLIIILTKSDQKVTGYDLRVGLLLPFDDLYLKPLVGYETSAGAVTLALERIRQEHILPGANISFLVRNCECKEDITAGISIDLLANRSVDVIISSPCGPTAFIVAVMSMYYNVACINWAATTVEVSDADRFQTVSRTIGSSVKLGKAVTEYLNYFGWRRVALFFTDDGIARKCYSVAEGLAKYLPKADIMNVFPIMIDGDDPSDEDIDRFLKGFKEMARVAIVCLDQGARRFMLRAAELGMVGEEWVYILPEYVQNENKTDIWTNFKNNDGRNTEAKLAYDSALFIEMLLSSSEELHYFKKQVIVKMKEWPFYHRPQSAEEQYVIGSLYSPFLHDAVYLYALALNKTLKEGGKMSDGRLVIQNSKGMSFNGASGFVSIDANAGRDPVFILKGLDRNKRMIQFAQCKLSKSDGQVHSNIKTVELLVPEDMMWENRNGYKPTGAPKCGWLGNLCMDESDSSSFTIVHLIVIAVSIVTMTTFIILLGLIFYIKRRVLVNEMAQMLWKISFKDIIQLKDLHDRSHASFHTVSSALSDDTTEAMMKGNESIACYKNNLVWLKAYNSSMVMSSEKDHVQMKMQRDITHDNLNPFIGLSLDTTKPISVWTYLSKGSLEDVLQNQSIKLDWFFKYSFIRDITAGLEHLMDSGLQSHGHFKSSNCLVDSRWVVKITDYGLHNLREGIPHSAKDKLWMAPELLRISRVPPQGTQKGDIYSLSIVMSEILSRERVYGTYEDMSNEEIVAKVRRGEQPLFRPTLKNERDADVDANMVQLMKDCWIEEPDRRPEIKEIRAAIKSMGKGKNTNLMDHVLKMMETHSKALENQVSDRTKCLSDEMQKSEDLLYRMLPRTVVERLRRGQAIEPETYEGVTILFSQVTTFASVTIRSTPLQIVQLLNDLYQLLDSTIEKYDVYKVETINDQYLIVSGLPHRNGHAHASQIADLALHFQLSMGNFYSSSMPREKFELRVGINSGSVVAGVVGNAMPRYCLFGDTVNTASRIETNGKPSCIHISDETNRLLTQVIGGYLTKARGEIIIKGKGVMFTYWLMGKKIKGIQDKTEETVDMVGHREDNL